MAKSLSEAGYPKSPLTPPGLNDLSEIRDELKLKSKINSEKMIIEVLKERGVWAVEGTDSPVFYSALYWVPIKVESEVELETDLVKLAWIDMPNWERTMGLRGLLGKTAIVTGAAGGIGVAATLRLLEEGCNVVAVDLDVDNVRNACGEPDPERFVALAVDVSTPEGSVHYVNKAVERFGGVELFVNNAGILGTRKPIVDMPVEDFDRIIAINLRGVFLGLQAVMRQMIKQGTGGAIVNTSSVGAFKTSLNSAGYGTSKNGVISLTKVAALENGQNGIRVNAICPGFTDTPLLAAAFGPQEASASSAKLPVGRIAYPFEIASMMAYLLSEEASYQTGGVYVVDGGLLLL